MKAAYNPPYNQKQREKFCMFYIDCNTFVLFSSKSIETSLKYGK